MKTQQSNRSGGAWLMFDKLGAVGAILSGVVAPCCFPLFATIGGVLGLGSIPILRDNVPGLIQAMTTLAFAGQTAAYRQHRRRGPLLTSAASVGLVILGRAVLPALRPAGDSRPCNFVEWSSHVASS